MSETNARARRRALRFGSLARKGLTGRFPGVAGVGLDGRACTVADGAKGVLLGVLLGAADESELKEGSELAGVAVGAAIGA